MIWLEPQICYWTSWWTGTDRQITTPPQRNPREKIWKVPLTILMVLTDPGDRRFLPRDAMPVRLSHAGILSKQLCVLSNFVHRRVERYPSFSVPNHMAVLWRVLPLTGVSNARGMKKRDFRRIFRFIERWRQAPYNIHPEPSPAADCTAHAGCSIGSVERQRTRNSHSSQAVPLRLQEIACLHYWQHVTLTALIQLTTW